MTNALRLAAFSLILGVGASACNPGGSGGPEVTEDAIRANILGTAYLGQQKWVEAEAAFRRAIEIRPNDPRPANNLAVALMQQGQNDQAATLLEAAIRNDPEFPWAHFNLGLLGKNSGDFEAAAAHFFEVAKQDPDDLLTQYNLGIVLSRIEREAEAEAAFRKALVLNPTHVSSLYGLGRLLLQRGDQEEGARLVSLSQEIRARSGLDAAVGTQYGEQGPYAMGSDYPGDTLMAPDAIDVEFSSAAALESNGPVWAVAFVGTDSQPALFGVGSNRVNAVGTATAMRIDFPSFLPDGSSVAAMTAADWNNDHRVDLGLLVRQGEELLFGILLQEETNAVIGFRWSPQGLQPAAPMLAGAGEIFASLIAVDRDHDGDLDAFWCWSGADTVSGCRIATQEGPGSYRIRNGAEHGIELTEMAAAPIQVALSDLDNDRDVDLIVLEAGGLHVLSNQRDDRFSETSAALGLGEESGGRSMRVADLDKDGFMDLLVADGDRVRLWLNRVERFEASSALNSLRDAQRVVVIDYDNDGLLDIAYGSESGLRFARNLGQGRWKTKANVKSPAAAPLAAVDADLDGDLDLIGYDGGLRVLRNDGGNARHWIAVASQGVGDNRFGIGTKVEILAGGLRQKFELTDSLPLHVGLGDRTTVESVRYLWPSGVLQDEVEQVGDRVATIEQLDRKGTSCPLLYAWDGTGWNFVTDFLGGAAVGFQQAPGRFNTPDTDEYVKIDGGLRPTADGLLRVRWNNQLEEVLWFDQAELVIVDHPEGTEIFPNERLMPGPPWPEFEIFSSADLREVRHARELENAVEVTAKLISKDRNYVDGFESLPYKGYAELHTLELEFDPVSPGNKAVLLLDGWIDYADSSANIAAHQAGVTMVPPRLSIADGKGGWLEPDHRMGFPAGLPKTMAVDLTGLLNPGELRVRLQTNMRIYWDRARLLVGDGSALPTVRRLAPVSAELRHGGFPIEATPDGKNPKAYDPSRTEAFRLWKSHSGAYTAYGPVEHLLMQVDDRMVTTRNGDEIELSFSAPPPPPTGWTRSYLIYADGFGKDMDPNSAAADTVGPVPFHGMPYYPYGAEVARPFERWESAANSRWIPAAPDGLHGVVAQAYVAEHGK